MSESISKFTPDVCEILKYYVYRLVDPRNGETFYVGKGKGNRVFAHAKDALKNYEGEGYLIESEDDISLKIKTIREIKDSGLEVIKIIQMYGLSQNEAFLVESVLIDVFSLNQILTNKVKGHYSDIEPMNVVTLQRDLSAEEYKDDPSNPNYVIIKVKESTVQANNGDRYLATRAAWKMDLKKAKNYRYVLSVTNGIVKEVYKDCAWSPSKTEEGRIEFDGVVAENSVRNYFINKKIPSKYRKKGNATPFHYCKL